MNNLPPMTLLDYMVSSRENNMLKAFLPYVDRDFQPMLATYIKYSELLATVELFSRGRNVFANKVNNGGFTDIISSMLPYVSEKEREAFETINNIKNAMDMFESYKDLLTPDMMSAFTGGEEGSQDNTYSDSSDISNSSDNSDNVANEPSDTSSDNMSDMLSSMLTPEQQLLFEQLSGMMNN